MLRPTCAAQANYLEEMLNKNYPNRTCRWDGEAPFCDGKCPPDNLELVRLIRFWHATATEAIGHPKGQVVGPDVGLERAAANKIGLVAGKAELVIPGQRELRGEAIFKPHQPFDRNAIDLIVERAGLSPRSQHLARSRRRNGWNRNRTVLPPWPSGVSWQPERLRPAPLASPLRFV